MATFKCKMCGGALEISTGTTVIQCDYCGTQQTLPKLDDEKRANLYDRANHFRRSNEFDKATTIYESILNEDDTDAEAYWSLVLCRYGIEYVEDPASHKRIPTVNRAQYTSIFDDSNYKAAIENADMHQRLLYEQEAKAINEIQKGILSISQKEEPFDIFICYKETDESGKRTRDSVLAQDLYYELTEEGFKVFFAKITLEDKLGSAYEPYIFAALNSAKVMVVLGTKPEHFNAVWVKNEWSRFLALIKNGEKKTLVPAYRDMEAYDLPQEFSHLQAQDMSKLGFMQDLVRGIEKIVGVKKKPSASNSGQKNQAENDTVAPMLKRMFMFLEDGEWSNADKYCEKILDIDPECSKAYIGKTMAIARVKKLDQLHKADFSSSEISKFYDKACRFSSPEEYDLYREQHRIYEQECHTKKFYIGNVAVSQTTIDKLKSMASTNKLEAIKYVREITDMGLKEAREWVDDCLVYDLTRPQSRYGSSGSQNYSSYSPSASQSQSYKSYEYTPRPQKFYIGTTEVTKDDIRKLEVFISADLKDSAIRHIQKVAHLSAKDAYKWIENFQSHNLNSPQGNYKPVPSNTAPKTAEAPKKAEAPKEAPPVKFYIGTVEVKKEAIDKINSLMADGKKLDAIKFAREATGMSLADTKKWVENYKSYDLNNPQTEYHSYEITTTKPTPKANSLDPITQAQIKQLEEKRRKQILWGCLCLVYWPIAVILFICASSTKKKIKALKAGESISSGNGCYVATCVYGSYDCPQVWTLRRYRDNVLASTWYGRLFIRTYYAISPTLVKWFGDATWFKKLWKGKLDRMVKKLQTNGVESTPYKDKI